MPIPPSLSKFSRRFGTKGPSSEPSQLSEPASTYLPRTRRGAEISQMSCADRPQPHDEIASSSHPSRQNAPVICPSCNSVFTPIVSKAVPGTTGTAAPSSSHWSPSIEMQKAVKRSGEGDDMRAVMFDEMRKGGRMTGEDFLNMHKWADYTKKRDKQFHILKTQLQSEDPPPSMDQYLEFVRRDLRIPDDPRARTHDQAELVYFHGQLYEDASRRSS